jgi:predicted metal-dependent enzyme (double-stranded beta helix superfamily)
MTVLAAIEPLVDALDDAVTHCACNKSTCEAVATALESLISPDANWLPASVMIPADNHYARNLVYRDPQGRYSVIAMVWSPGQGTPIHDHGGLWVVECVYRGRIQVETFDKVGEAEPDTFEFSPVSTLVAGCGEAGALIPPYDYHRLGNPFEIPTVTLHVYGGDLTQCNVYEPLEANLYRRELKSLSLD